MFNAYSCSSILFAADFRTTNANKNDGSGYALLGLYFVICIREFDKDFLHNNVTFYFTMLNAHRKVNVRTSIDL